MSMINLREAPLVDKPEDGATLFALNPDGTINRISAENVGGSKVAKIRMATEEGENLSLQNLTSGAATLAAEDGARAGSSTTFPCVCDNMTYEEAAAIVKAGDKLDATLEVEGIIYAVGAQFNSAPATVMLFFELMGMSVIVYWTADGITMTVLS